MLATDAGGDVCSIKVTAVNGGRGGDECDSGRPGPAGLESCQPQTSFDILSRVQSCKTNVEIPLCRLGNPDNESLPGETRGLDEIDGAEIQCLLGHDSQESSRSLCIDGMHQNTRSENEIGTSMGGRDGDLPGCGHITDSIQCLDVSPGL